MAAVCAVIFTGCKKDQEAGETITLGVNLEQVGGPNSKIFMNGDIPEFFTTGEVVNVNGEQCTIAVNNGAYQVEPTRAENGIYYAFYPASTMSGDFATSGENVTCSVTFPHLQNYIVDATSNEQKLNLPVGARIDGSGTILNFYNLCSLVEVNYTPTNAHTLQSIEVSAEGVDLWGSATAVINGTSSRLNMTSYNGDHNRVVLETNNLSLTANTQYTFYVMVPPFPEGTNAKLTAKMRFADGTGSDYALKSFSKTTNNAVNLPRNTIASITTNQEPEEETELTGYYSISSTCKVVFSKGNLQHRGAINDVSASTWHFAENQYDYYGSANMGSYNLSTTVDLFCWSITNENFAAGEDDLPAHTFGLRAPENSNDYCWSNPTFSEWGQLVIDGDPANTWFTLTSAEWEYLLETRTNAGALRINVNITDIPNHATGQTTIHGCMLFPDDWTIDRVPSGITLTTGQVNNLSYTDFRRLEAVGCVLLPEAGYRDVGGFHHNWAASAMTYQVGYYWTSTYAGSLSDGPEAYYMQYNYNASQYVANSTTSDGVLYYGNSVRLVKPAPGYTYANANRTGPSSSK